MTARDQTSRKDDKVESLRPLSSEVLAEVAHELRAPLGGIEAMAAVIAGGELSPAQRQATEALLASVAHLREVAGVILDQHRADALVGSEIARPQGLQLGGLLNHIATAARARAASQKIEFSLRVAEGVPEAIRADGTHLRQMIENLLDNAFKVTRTGAVSLNVDRIGRRNKLHELRFAVRDSGPGFTGEQAKNLFERFSRIDDTVPGTGIGLSLVRRLAETMGGEAKADSTPGSGAIVWFTILVEAEKSQAPMPQPVFSFEERRAMRTGGRLPTILVVDDNLASRMVMAVLLEQFGCDVRLACSGAEALDILRRDTFDTVMMDMTMSGMDGSETTRRIRALPAPYADVPVIAVTGRVGEADQARFRDAGANAFVPKPVAPRTVWQSLCEVGVFKDDEARIRSVA